MLQGIIAGTGGLGIVLGGIIIASTNTKLRYPAGLFLIGLGVHTVLDSLGYVAT